jgi:hypothetical protein
MYRNFQHDNYTRQAAGKQKIANLPKEIATFLGLPNPLSYTGHCLRATSATLLADAGISMMNLKRHGGWKSDTVVEGYLRESKKLKADTATMLATGSDIPLAMNPTPTQLAEAAFQGAKFSNCTINVIYN